MTAATIHANGSSHGGEPSMDFLGTRSMESSDRSAATLPSSLSIGSPPAHARRSVGQGVGHQPNTRRRSPEEEMSAAGLPSVYDQPPSRGIDRTPYGCYANMCPYRGGQAQFLRAPFGDFNLLAPGAPGGDLWSRPGWAYGGPQLASEGRDRSVRRRQGEGPIPSRHRGRRESGGPARGRAGRSNSDATDGAGAEKGIGHRLSGARSDRGEEHSELVLDNLVQVVRTAGAIGVVGVYVPEDPGATDEKAKDGRVGFDYGTFFTKGQRMGTGQAPVKRYNRELRDLISAGRARRIWSLSHELSLNEAPRVSGGPLGASECLSVLGWQIKEGISDLE